MSDRCPHCGAVLIPGQPLCTECGKPTASGATAQGSRATNAPAGGPQAVRLPRRDKQKDFAFVGRTVAGKYKVLDVLGQGGFGTVYLVEITAGMVGEKLALKILPEELSAQPAFRNQFLNEIRAAMRVVDRYIAQIRDVGATEDGLLYYTMDLCPGVTLAQLVRDEGKLPIPRALLIVMNVLRGVQTAHAAGIIHRDLKPANIMVQSQGGKDAVRILDFGIATAVQSGEKQKGFVGSPHYMPPEQFMGEQIGFYTDLYAVGVMLYECITGGRPYVGNTPQEVFKSLKTRPPATVDALLPEAARYPGLSELIGKAIEKNPELRFQSARELFDAVNAIMTRATAPARSGPGAAPGAAAPARGTARRVRRRRVNSVGRESRSRTAAAMLATVIVAATVAGVVFSREISRWWDEKIQRRQPDVPPAAAPEARPKPKTVDLRPESAPSRKAVIEPSDKTIAEQKAAASAGLASRSGALVEACEKALEQKDFAAAVEKADSLIGIDPQDHEAYRLRGLAALGLRDFKLAASFLEKARSLAAAKEGGEFDPSLLSSLAEAKMSLTPPELSDAEILLKESLHKSPRDPTTILRFARLLDMEGKRPEARRVLQAARQGRIDSPEIEELWQKFVAQDAGKLREEAIQLATGAQEALEKGELAKSVELATKSREVVPTANADLIAADALVELGKLDDAERVLSDALDRRPEPPAVALTADETARIEGRLGYLKGLDALASEKDEASDGKFQTAAAAFEKAAQRFPKGVDAKQQLRLQTLGSLALARGRAQRGEAAAVAGALAPLQKDPSPRVLVESARVHLLLARSVEQKEVKSQAYASAKKELQALLRIKDLPDDLRRDGNFLLGTAQLAAGDLERNESAYPLAIASFAAAEKAGLKSKELYEGWANAYDRAGNLIKAAQLFRSSYDISPSPEKCLRAVEYYLNANPKSPEALELIRQGRDLFKDSREIERKYLELTR